MRRGERAKHVRVDVRRAHGLGRCAPASRTARRCWVGAHRARQQLDELPLVAKLEMVALVRRPWRGSSCPPSSSSPVRQVERHARAERGPPSARTSIAGSRQPSGGERLAEQAV